MENRVKSPIEALIDISIKLPDSDVKVPGKTKRTRICKKRASIACKNCRSRKVRCDLVYQKSRGKCWNCAADGCVCEVEETTRQRLFGIRKKKSLMPSPKCSPVKLPMPTAMTPERDADKVSPLHRDHGAKRHQHHPATIPSYIKPVRREMAADTLDYLQLKGAMTLPSIEVCTKLLQSYADFVDGFMPIVDLDELVAIVEGRKTENRISLILFQAIMFAGAAFVDMEALHVAGYRTRLEARKSFFQKVRLLYDMDHETDRIAILQSVLLLTSWYEHPCDHKETWHWMGIATSLACTLGLHRNPGVNVSLDQRRMRKCLWWSCFVQDRILALGMRRPIRLRMEDFNIPMLTLEDMEVHSKDTIKPEKWVQNSIQRDPDQRLALAIMYLAKIRLCFSIGQVVAVHGSSLSNNEKSTDDNSPKSDTSTPGKLHSDNCKICRYDRELVNWLEDLPPEAQYDFARPGDNHSILVHKSVLHMIYHTTVSALHRPRVLQWDSSNREPQLICTELETSHRKAREAAAEVTIIASALYVKNLVRYLPLSGVNAMIPAVIVHLLDLQSPDVDERCASLQSVYRCMLVLMRLLEMYAAADFAAKFFNSAARSANIILPLPSIHPAMDFDDHVGAGQRAVMQTISSNPTLPQTPASIINVQETTGNLPSSLASPNDDSEREYVGMEDIGQPNFSLNGDRTGFLPDSKIEESFQSEFDELISEYEVTNDPLAGVE